MVKKTKSSEKWGQLLASAIITLNLFVVLNEILDKIFITSFDMSFKMDQDQPLAILPNVVSSGRSSLVLETKQSPSVGLSVLKNWADQIETKSSSPLVSGATFGDAWELLLVIKGLLDTAFLVELTSSVHLATLKIAKSLVVSESGSPSAAVALCDMPLGVSATDIKAALNVFVTFGSQADLNLAVAKTGHLAVDCKVALSPFFKAFKMFKPHFVGFLSYTKTSAPPVISEFFSLVASAPLVAVVDPAVRSRLDSLEKQISNLAALVKSIVEPVGSLVVLVSHLFDNNAVKTVQIEKNLLFIKYASNNFANLLVGVSKDIACLRSEVDFGGMDYNNIQATKSSLLSENTVKHIVALW
ncbi:hypothetical protein G9A89_006518 [Geosiphon pyriformis]|nr:hypothetical protein G9A89_006518 [Geosiphon pyriformis]